MRHADVVGRDLEPLRKKRLWLFDMDGTLYEGDRVFAGTKELLWGIRARGGEYVFVTNNSSRDVSDYVERVTRMGIDADEGCFHTSLDATVALLREEHPGQLVYCMGTRSMVAGLRAAGVAVTERAGDGATVALIGYDTELDYGKLREASAVVASGVPYYATNCDLACPVPGGFVPDCGAIARMLECATGRMPRFLGKPEPTMVLPLLRERGVAPEQAVIVGDRLYTDIALGVNSGVDTVCVLTGESTMADIEASSIAPSWIARGTRQLAGVVAT